jgi:hypothetical protein
MAFGKETAIAKAMRDLEEAAIAQDLSAEKVANLRTGLMDGRLLKQATRTPPPTSRVVGVGVASSTSFTHPYA